MAELITTESAERTRLLARRLLPRDCPGCKQPVVFPRREAAAGTGGNYLVCNPVPTDRGTVTLRDRGEGVGIRATVHARVHRGHEALELHRCPERVAADVPPPVAGSTTSPWYRPGRTRATRR